MALAQATLIQRVRRILGDTPAMQLASTADASDLTVTVADSSLFAAGAVLEFQNNGEQVVVASITNATTIECYSRGFNGTTAATQASGLVYIDPTYTWIDIENAIERTIQSLWPKAWKQGSDTITPDTTTQWFDLDSTAIDLIAVRQQYGDADQYVAGYGEKDSGLPVMFGTHVPTAVAASGIGLRFPNGFAHDTNTVYVNYRAKITTTETVEGTYDDVTEGLMAEAVVYGAAAKIVGFKEIPLVTSKDVSQGSTPLGPQQRLTASAWLEDQYRRTLNDLYDELLRTIPPMGMWN